MKLLKKLMILFLALVFSLSLTSGLNTEAKEPVPFEKTPGTFPLVEVQVAGSDELEALFDEALDLDIFGYESDGYDFTVTVQIHGD